MNTHFLTKHRWPSVLSREGVGTNGLTLHVLTSSEWSLCPPQQTTRLTETAEQRKSWSPMPGCPRKLVPKRTTVKVLKHTCCLRWHADPLAFLQCDRSHHILKLREESQIIRAEKCRYCWYVIYFEKYHNLIKSRGMQRQTAAITAKHSDDCADANGSHSCSNLLKFTRVKNSQD